MDIQLISIDPLTRVVSFKMSTKKVTGIMKLVQMVVLSLMNTPGKDYLDPSMGGGIPSMVGMNIDPNNMAEVLGEVTRRVKTTSAEVMTAQIGRVIPSDEKLKELRLVSVAPGANIGEVAARIRIINELGQQAEAVI